MHDSEAFVPSCPALSVNGSQNRRAKSKEEHDLKRQQDKLTNHLKQRRQIAWMTLSLFADTCFGLLRAEKTWVDNIMDSNWVDAEV